MGLNLQPVLNGELVRLSPLRPEHFEELFAVASDPLIWEQHPSSDRYKEKVFRDYFRGGLESGGALLARDAADDRVIGSSRYYGYDAAAGEVEIGWTFLARSHWGGRYNADMKDLMLRHAYEHVDRVIFVIGATNRRSQLAIQKIGARLRDAKPKQPGREGLVFELSAATYLARR